MSSNDRNALISCSFCRKTTKEVRLLIAGPLVNICDECVYLCVDILAESSPPQEGPSPGPVRPHAKAVWSPAADAPAGVTAPPIPDGSASPERDLLAAASPEERYRFLRANYLRALVEIEDLGNELKLAVAAMAEDEKELKLLRPIAAATKLIVDQGCVGTGMHELRAAFDGYREWINNFLVPE